MSDSLKLSYYQTAVTCQFLWSFPALQLWRQIFSLGIFAGSVCVNKKPAVLFCYAAGCMGSEKAKMIFGLPWMQPVLYSYWSDRKMPLGVAPAESPPSTDAKGSKACEGHTGLLLPSPQACASLSTLFCLPHPVWCTLSWCIGGYFKYHLKFILVKSKK